MPRGQETAFVPQVEGESDADVYRRVEKELRRADRVRVGSGGAITFPPDFGGNFLVHAKVTGYVERVKGGHEVVVNYSLSPTPPS